MSNWLSVYILAPVAAWLVAQALKTILELPKPKAQRNNNVFRSGNMPSAHSAIVAALLTVLGIRLGFDSPLFAVAAVFASIVIYDAVNVRRSVGEQGDALQKLASTDKIFVAHGHKLSEVVAGFVIGVAISLLMLQIL
jgi:acid phosphatase family membrane protein YuiD